MVRQPKNEKACDDKEQQKEEILELWHFRCFSDFSATHQQLAQYTLPVMNEFHPGSARAATRTKRGLFVWQNLKKKPR